MKMLKDFIGFYKPHRKLFYWDMVCAMVIALADLFYPTIARNIINVYVPNKMWNMFALVGGAAGHLSDQDGYELFCAVLVM